MDTLFMGKNILRLNNVDSTNNYAARLLRQSGSINVPEGTIIVADFQEKGKGQRGNGWEGEAGKNLTFTVILKPMFLTPDRQFLLNKVISLAVLDFITSLGITTVRVKWPNDIYVQHNKIAGILIENTISSQQILSSVVGIGLNVNQTEFKTAWNATSLKTILQQEMARDYCMDRLCSAIEARYLKLKTSVFSLDMDYLDSLYRYNECSNYIVNNQKISAKITGISPAGLLILQLPDGREKRYDFKEVVFVQ